ncbi:UspA domain protein (plasmid) [Natrialba magadii ATCC 43099]|uniref:UspA domain protein n=1 Tax=Natrialba magadii (strain ATCC 43099 / DSM 3394 / CCM 3739 / CIP 104546 / IAM 13178 / JCM 8861 / NBRC 102185 / NCIMB 2190 / MS3) TaxID=547559 RepID=D3T1B3_NATMM|nr:universal stress protein [Natrialba magadii]ADD07372.1 UspA domain protein [Natrialba magadii ATCC 43099]ELY32442.1 UspA domain-containing protein [Natrialba magadii ATCC 43099]
MTRLIDSILIPTDDSEGALAGAKHAIALASQTGADVHVLSVVAVRSDLEGITDAMESMYASLEDDAKAAVETIADMVRSYDEDLEVTTTVKRGTPFQSIREYATRREIDIIAMGTKGRDGVDRVLLGSVTENVLRTARTPVLVVPPEANLSEINEIAFDEFLLPTDGSDGAAIAADWGIALASRLESMVHTVYSAETSRLSRAKTPDELLDALEQSGEDAIEAVREQATDAGVSITGTITTGSPADVILTAATERDADLIVMGTHGRTGIGQWFLGSVTENVVRQADVPVFCVPVSAESP